MSAALITGLAGAGKSTIAGELARRGLTSIDAGNDPLLAGPVGSAGNAVEDLSVPDLASSAAGQASEPSNQSAR
jgi:hypothetical protein